ncbi:acetolactate decarboxylase [Streptomyces sp. NPDC006012]|uniref:acetolactate decarboxylase n=1 Tax=Streptomyces sp. NPDC006012 TaxID=3364739 RepID=UPI0036A8EC9E
MNTSPTESPRRDFRRWAGGILAHHSAGTASGAPREVFQTSTIGALLAGVYDGDVTIGELLEHGDFGLGTFNRLDGEMLVLDGVCYHLRADGSVRPAGDDELTPFAAVTRFAPDIRLKVTAPCCREALVKRIDEAITSENLLYAVRVTGEFRAVRTRTVMEQEPPYPPLTEATAGQQETVLHDVLVDGGPRLVVCRHECNAALMAAAAGRLTGIPGATIVTSGPGTTNTFTGLITATTEQYPVIALCGAVPRRDRLKRTHQSMDATAALKPFTKYVGEVNDPDNVPETVANALRAAVTEPRGATAVVLPSDIVGAPTSASVTRPQPVPALGPAPQSGIRKAAELIRNARRPVVLVGMRAADAEPCAALRRLLAGTELPVVETFQAAGVVSRALEDHFVGRVGLFRNQPGDILISHADVLVTIGYDAVEYDPGLWNTDPARTVVHIDSVPADVDNHYQPTVELRGDIAATVTALAASVSGLRLDDDAKAAVGEQRAALERIDREARNAAMTEEGLDPAAVVLKLRELVDDDATVVSDVGSHYIYMARHFRGYEPQHVARHTGGPAPAAVSPRLAGVRRPGPPGRRVRRRSARPEMSCAV